MKDDLIEDILKNGIKLLEDILPKKKYLYFPLLYTTFFWIMHRPKEWSNKIFSWKIWSDPGRITIKPDEFVLFFFDFHDDLSKEYKIELGEKNIRKLRKAFVCLYPILGLGDPFLEALFHKELEEKKFRSVEKDFSNKINQAISDIESAKGRSVILIGLSEIFENLISISDSLLKTFSSRKAIATIIEKHLGENNE